MNADPGKQDSSSDASSSTAVAIEQPARTTVGVEPDPGNDNISLSQQQTHKTHVDLENADFDNPTELKQTKSIAETLSLPHELAFISVICTAQFTTQVGLGQCLSILHVIGASFGITNPGGLSWLIAGYSLTVGTFILIFGRFGDLFGYKRMLVIGFSWFAVWSMVAGLAVYSNHVLFTFARALQGIGPAIVLPNGLAILGATYAPGRRKEMVFAIFGATAPAGAVIGAAFAGVFSLAWWPWTFWSFAIVLAFTAAAAVIVIPDPPKKCPSNYTLRQKLSSLDLLGAVVGIAALVLFNFAWNQAPTVGWQEPYIYVLLIISIALIPLFFYIELRIASSPLIPFSILSADVSLVLACVACGWACFGVWTYYTFQLLQVLRHASPLLSAACISPVAVSGAAAAVTTGFLLSRLRPAWVMTAALTAFTVGTILIATAPVGQTYWAQTFVCTVIIPWGMDMSFPAATLILSNAVDKEHQGMAASLVATIVNYSISLGLGFAGTVEVHVNNGGKTPEDILKGYRGAWYVAIGLAGLGIVLSLSFVVKSYWQGRKGKP